MMGLPRGPIAVYRANAPRMHSQVTMDELLYARLAEKLDKLPNRFPATESRMELRMLSKLFSREEAELACALELDAESAEAISIRTQRNAVETRNTLKRMVAKGLIDLKKGDGGFAYALRPFVVGFYEGQLSRMDVEMAELFEQYYHGTRGGVLRPSPALHRIIPVDRAIPVKISIAPYEQVAELLERAESWGVRDCICRKQQRLLGKGCNHKLESCIVFAPVKNAFARSTVDRALTKKEALDILLASEEEGLVHSSGNYREGIDYICNCCTCCCGIMRGIAEYGIRGAVAHSDYEIALDAESCSGCGACVERCQFHALSLADHGINIERTRCVGCGLCVVACPTEALSLALRDSRDILVPPATIKEWRSDRTSLGSSADSIAE